MRGMEVEAQDTRRIRTGPTAGGHPQKRGCLGVPQSCVSYAIPSDSLGRQIKYPGPITGV